MSFRAQGKSSRKAVRGLVPGLMRGMLAGLLALSAGVSLAQEFPAKAMRVIVCYPPGGTPDVVARFLGQMMTASLGQAITVENKPGAGGIVGVTELINSAPDGYSMIIADVGPYAIAPAMTPGAYDPVKSLQPLGQVTTNSVFVMITPKIPAKNMQELLALIKSRPGLYNYSTPGVGTVHHLFGEALKAAYGLNLNHVPFKGSSQILPSMLNGDVSIAIIGMTNTPEHIKAGKLLVLAASTRERDKLFAPDVPSASEFGAPDLDYAGDMGYFVPAGTPKPIADKLAAALAKAATSPEFAARGKSLGVIVQYRNAEQFGELVRVSYARYQKIVATAGIKAQ